MGCEVYTYNDLTDRIGKCRAEIMLISGDGFARINKNNIYQVFFNEEITPEERIRFTQAHELGHIVLNHLVDFDFLGIDEEKRIILDREANAFASEILGPEIILFLMQCHNDIDSIHDICSISYQAAEVKYRRLYNQFAMYLNEIRILLVKQFKGYINSFYDMNQHMQKKLSDIKCYRNELGQYVCWN